MTRLAVLSDIHGNLPALQAVMADMETYAIDHVVVAGDHINCGPFSREVLEVITAQHWSMIRGNNELYILDHETPRAPAHWSTFTLPPIIQKQLGEKWINVIAGMPDTLSLRFRDAPPIRVLHGIPDNPWYAIFPLSPPEDVCQWLANIPETTVIGAHSHLPMERQVDRWHIFNPGSVGMPLDGELTASYIILDGDADGWTLAEYRRVPFDYSTIYATFEQQQFVEQGGVAARLIVEEFRTGKLRIYPFHRWKEATYPDEPETQAILDEFCQIDDLSPYMPINYVSVTPELFRDMP